MIRLLILIAYCILAIHFPCLQAQSYSSVHYDTKDGLPSGTVYDITQDKTGFIWFGTENGLCRFDGKNFRTYTTKDGLPDNSVLKVHGDSSGRVYFTPFTHSLYYYQNDSFFRVSIPDKFKIDLSVISSFANKGSAVLLAGIQEGYVLENNQAISIFDRYNKTAKQISHVRIYDSSIMMRSGDSIFHFPDSGKMKSYFSKAKENTALIFDEKGEEKEVSRDKKLFFTVKEYFRNNLLYEYSENFVKIYNASTGSLVHKIRSDKFSDAFVDNEDNLWISTLGEGVYRFPSFEFRHMKFDGKTEIFSLIKFGPDVLAGSDFSKMHITPSENFEADYSVTDFSKITSASGNSTSRITKRNRIYVLRSEGKDLYIGTDAFLLKKTGSLDPVFRNIYPVKDIDVNDGGLLICTGYNVLVLDKQNLTVKDTLLRQRATCGISYKGAYYIGTLGGLIKINPATKSIYELYNSFPPFSGRIVSLRRGIHDDLWIATSGSGLVRFKDGKIWQTVKEEDGLTSDICTSLFIDSNLVWLGTNNGLNRIETGKEKPYITRFTSASGLGADFINAVIATDSNVYVGTAAGLTSFGKNILSERSVCILHILQLSANNKKLKNDSSYSFPSNTLNIQIDFTAISFKSAGDITYYYELEGLDKTWNRTTSNFVNFPTLQPRKYTLRLKAINKFGVESETKSIRLIILPAWWQTWLFRIIALSFFGLLILLLYRYNIRNIKRKEETKREIESRFAALEQRALQAQMNPHFIFNALNSIQTFILNLDAEGANTYLTRFASLIRQTLENSMQPFITVASELKYLETYLGLEKLRFRDKFEYKIHIDETIDQNNTLLPGMLLQPYIENSIRHGIQHRKDNNGLISLNINKTSDNSISYTIKDNGVGRKKTEELKSSRHIEYQSRGMFINSKRIAAMNNQFRTNIRVKIEDLAHENESAAGTSVTILIPPLEKPPA